MTATATDLFTDREGYAVYCKNYEERPQPEISIGQHPDGEIFIALRIPIHFDADIPILLRVDQGEIIRRTGQWDIESDRAYLAERALALRLLHKLARGHRLAIKVGDKGWSIPPRWLASCDYGFSPTRWPQLPAFPDHPTAVKRPNSAPCSAPLSLETRPWRASHRWLLRSLRVRPCLTTMSTFFWPVLSTGR